MDKVNREEAKDKLGGAELVDVLASDIRVVTLDFVKGGSSTYMVHVSELEVFKEATLKLHFSPGINPANKVKTSKVWRLRSAKLMAQGPYWWATPGLDSSTPGAMTIHEGIFETLWIDKSYKVRH